jgi:hypothetical protein
VPNRHSTQPLQTSLAPHPFGVALWSQNSSLSTLPLLQAAGALTRSSSGWQPVTRQTATPSVLVFWSSPHCLLPIMRGAAEAAVTISNDTRHVPANARPPRNPFIPTSITSRALGWPPPTPVTGTFGDDAADCQLAFRLRPSISRDRSTLRHLRHGVATGVLAVTHWGLRKIRMARAQSGTNRA